jgi:prepilin-type N-terminal cleavage/methylation domain-containing protein
MHVVFRSAKAHFFRGANGDDPTRLGFTLVEVLVVVMILAILASVVVPVVSDSANAKLRGAATVLARDIQYVQSEALNTGQTLRIEFIGKTQYRVVDPDGGPGGSARVLPHPQSDAPAHGGMFVVDLSDPGPLRGATITSAKFGGQSYLEFGRYGETISGGEIVIRTTDRQVRLSVSATTGAVTVGHIESAK